MKVIYIYGVEQCARSTARTFNQRQPDEHMDHKYITLAQKFKITRSLLEQEKTFKQDSR